MSLPRVRLRTLMLAVAVAGVEFFLLTSVSGPFVIQLPVGPLAGIAWTSFRLPVRPCAYLWGSVWGSLIQAVALTLVLPGSSVYEQVLGIHRIGNEWASIACQLWIVPLTSVVAGVAIGLLAELGLLLSRRLTPSWRSRRRSEIG